MKTIAFVAGKGGAGKTTSCAHMWLAGTRCGLSMHAIDTDKQRSLTEWAEARERHHPDKPQVELYDVSMRQLAGRIDRLRKVPGVLLIDTPGQHDADTVDHVIAVADYIVIPLQPSPHDLRSIKWSIDRARRANKPFAFLPTNATDRTSIYEQVRETCQRKAPILGTLFRHVCYADSMVEGLTAMEWKGREAKQATSDVMSAFDALCDLAQIEFSGKPDMDAIQSERKIATA